MAISITTETLHPHQVRAARGLAGISMETLADVAGITAETVLRLESGRTVPTRSTASRIIHALARFDVILIGEGDGGGVGVRMREPGGNALVLRRDALRNGEIGTVVRVDGKPVTARVVADALAHGGTITDALAAFDLMRPAIARAVARKIAAGAIDQDGHLRITASDIAHIQARAA